MWKCKKCGEEHQATFDSCWQCGTRTDEAEPANLHQAPPATTAGADSASSRPKNKQASSKVLLFILLVVLTVIFFGNVHIITGGSLNLPRIVKKHSFGISETFIKIETITSMPWLAAKSRYPLSCAVLQREHLIESDDEFRERNQKEARDEMEKALQELRK